MKYMKKGIIILLVGILLGAAVLYLYATKDSGYALDLPIIADEDFSAIVQYNCEFSNGEFVNGACVCPAEEELGQTSDMMYDPNTGYCQTTVGGPAGDAFAASAGLPHGQFDYFNSIVINNCHSSGGSYLPNGCSCPEGDDYNQQTGFCEEGVSGVVQVGHFSGTEMGCMFEDGAVAGDTLRCNQGVVSLNLLTDDGEVVALEGYGCDATEVFVKEEESYRIDYETSNCTDGLDPGVRHNL